MSPAGLGRTLWKQRGLIYSLIYREVVGRYRGSFFGILWSFITPLIFLCVYTFVFGTIFRRSWTPGQTSSIDFPLILFGGLLVFNLFADCISKAPNSIAGKPSFVKKIVFPLEVLSISNLGAALFQCFITTVIWILAFMALKGTPPVSIVLAPLMLFPLVMFVLGLSWFLASLGVFIRDLAHVISVFITINLFISSVFFPISSVPEKYRDILLLSPLASGIEFFRQVAFFGTIPDFNSYAVQLAFGACAMVVGYIWFQRTRQGFADVL